MNILANKNPKKETDSGYQLRETDNRINRMKAKQQLMKSNNNKRKENTLMERNGEMTEEAIGSQSLSMKQMRRNGLTKYDAKLLMAQGCHFADVTQQVELLHDEENNAGEPENAATSVTRTLRNKNQANKTESNNNLSNNTRNHLKEGGSLRRLRASR